VHKSECLIHLNGVNARAEGCTVTVFLSAFPTSVMASCISYFPRFHPRRYHKNITVKPALPFDTGCSRSLADVVLDAHLSTLRCPARVTFIAFREVFIVAPHYSNRYFGGWGEMAEDESGDIFSRMWHNGKGVKMKVENVIASVCLGLYVELCTDVS